MGWTNTGYFSIFAQSWRRPAAQDLPEALPHASPKVLEPLTPAPAPAPASGLSLARVAPQAHDPAQTAVAELSARFEAAGCYEIAFGRHLLQTLHRGRPLYLGVSYATYLAHAVARGHSSDIAEALSKLKTNGGLVAHVKTLVAADWMLETSGHLERTVQLWAQAVQACAGQDPATWQELREWQAWAAIRADAGRTPLPKLAIDANSTLHDFYETFRDDHQALRGIAGAQALAMLAFALQDEDLGIQIMASLADPYLKVLAHGITGADPGLPHLPTVGHQETCASLLSASTRTFCSNDSELPPSHLWQAGMLALNITYAAALEGHTEIGFFSQDEDIDQLTSGLQLARALDIHALMPLPWLNKVLRALLRHHPTRIDLLSRCAEAFVAQNDLPLACVALNAIRVQKEKQVGSDVYLRLADLYVQRDKLRDACTILETARTKFDDKRVLNVLARVYQREDPIANAAELVKVRRTLSHAYPRNDENWRRLAEALTVRREYKKAGDAYLRASQSGTGAADVLRAVGAYLACNEKIQAVRALETLQAQDSGLASASAAHRRRVEELRQSLLPARATKSAKAVPNNAPQPTIQAPEPVNLDTMAQDFDDARITLRPWFEREAARQSMSKPAPPAAARRETGAQAPRPQGTAVSTGPSRHGPSKRPARGKKPASARASMQQTAGAAPPAGSTAAAVGTRVTPELKAWNVPLGVRPDQDVPRPAVPVEVLLEGKAVPATYLGESADGEVIVHLDGAQGPCWGATLVQPPHVSTQVLDSVAPHNQYRPSAHLSQLLHAALDQVVAAAGTQVQGSPAITVREVVAALDADPRCQVVVAGGAVRDCVAYAHGPAKAAPKIKDIDLYVAVPIAEAIDIVEALVGHGQVSSPSNTRDYGMATVAGIDIRSIQTGGFYEPRRRVEGRSRPIPPAIFGSDVVAATKSVDVCCNTMCWMPSTNRLLDPTGRGLADISGQILSVPDAETSTGNRSWVWRYCIMRLRGWSPTEQARDFARAQAKRWIGQRHEDEGVGQAYRGDIVTQIIRALPKAHAPELLKIMRTDGFDSDTIEVARMLFESMAGIRASGLSPFAPSFASGASESARSWATRLFGDGVPDPAHPTNLGTKRATADVANLMHKSRRLASLGRVDAAAQLLRAGLARQPGGG